MNLNLHKLREVLGPIYGSENTSLLLYTIVKYNKPEVVLELGTGLGVSTLMIAQAIKENGRGIVITIDDDSHENEHFHNLDELVKGEELEFLKFKSTLKETLSLQNMAESLELSEFIRIVKTNMDFEGQILNVTDDWQLPGQKIDLVFSDFSHGPEECQKILLGLLPFLNYESELLIDSASSNISSLYALEKLVEGLEKGKIPRAIQMIKNGELRKRIIESCQCRNFSMSHFFQKGRDEQNSTLRINLSLPDYLPTFSTKVRV